MRKGNKWEEENYIVQEFDEDVQYEGISSRTLLHLGLTHFIVGNGNEVFELFEFHLSKCPNAE
jgi:hypothetical protein